MINGVSRSGQILLVQPVNNQWPMFVYQGSDMVAPTISFRGLFEVNLTVGWARRTYYVDNLLQSITGGGLSNSQYKRFNNGYSNFYMEPSFLYDMRDSNVLLMGVGSHKYMHKGMIGNKTRYEPDIIYVSEDLDTPRVISRLRSIRSIWRRALRVAKDRGIRVEKIPQKHLNRFIAKFNWQPDKRASDAFEANTKNRALSDVYGSIRT